MDFIKNVALILMLLLALAGVAHSQSWQDYIIWNDLGYYEDLRFDQKFFLAQRMELMGGISQRIVADGSNYIAYPTLFVKFESLSASPSSTVNLSYVCMNNSNTTLRRNLTLNNYPTWNRDGYVLEPLPITYNTTDLAPGFEEVGIKWISICNVKVDTNTNISAEVYLPVWTALLQEDDFKIPDQNLANLVTETRNITNTGFDLLDMMILITVMLFIFFILVVLYKVLIYFITELDKKWQRE